MPQIPIITSTARSYIRSRVEGVMEYTCRAERVVKGNHADDTLVYTPGTRTTLYEGPCRLWEISGASAIVVGDADIDIQQTQLSLPWDSPILKKNDEVVITASPSDPSMTNKRFQVESSSKSGAMRATRRYVVKMVSEK
jgi:hypothetical protein